MCALLRETSSSLFNSWFFTYIEVCTGTLLNYTSSSFLHCFRWCDQYIARLDPTVTVNSSLSFPATFLVCCMFCTFNSGPLSLKLPICYPTSHSRRVPLVLCLFCMDENREAGAPAGLRHGVCCAPAPLTVKVLRKWKRRRQKWSVALVKSWQINYALQ